MGASERDRADVPKPRPVWVSHGDWATESDWHPGLLLEWRSVEQGRGRGLRWEGLVVWARGGGELPWSLTQSWVRSTYIRPMYPAPPGHVAGQPTG